VDWVVGVWCVGVGILKGEGWDVDCMCGCVRGLCCAVFVLVSEAEGAFCLLNLTIPEGHHHSQPLSPHIPIHEPPIGNKAIQAKEYKKAEAFYTEALALVSQVMISIR
jgi:hypothetical protein